MALNTTEISGTAIVLYVNAGTVGTPNYVKVAYQRGLTRSMSQTFIDSSNKDSNDEKGIAGRRSSTLSLDMLYIGSDAGYQALEAARLALEPILVRRWVDGTAIDQANCIITELSESYPDNEAATASISLQVTGGWGAPA